MERDDLKYKLIAYLYDEMSSEERIRFEKEMETEPDLKNEFLELKQVRKGLSSLEDKEVMEPFFLWGRNGISGWSNPFKRRSLILFRPIVAVAASIVILMLIGYLTNFSISYQENQFFLGFNQPVAGQMADVLTEEQIKNLVKNEIDQNNISLLNRIVDTENKLDLRLATLETKQEQQPTYLQAKNAVNEQDLQDYYNQLRQTNATLVENYLQNATVQQQEYFQTVMNQFTEYLQDQREEDLRLIRRSLVSLKEDQDQQQLQTQQMLAALLNNVNNQNN
jgi:hypothetical protein